MSESTQSRAVEILLVEDNPGDVGLVQAALRRGKLANHLSIARDGEEALELLNKIRWQGAGPRPDLILLDLNLPKISGIEVLRQIKQDPELRRIPTVVMTSSKAEEDIARSYDLQANCYVTKPVEFEQFRSVVQSVAEFWFAVVKLTGNHTHATDRIMAESSAAE
jgi:chemotaxis family two-component system response regulator Rcp1